MKLAEHPTVKAFYDKTPQAPASPAPARLDADWLRQLCLDCGADDAGLVEISRPALDNQRDDILRYFPPAKTLLSFVCRMNRGPIRSPARSAANLEFHGSSDHANEVARKVVAALETRGVRAMNPSAGFPMEQDRFPGKIWVVSHKPVAMAAGLGHMGIHRNVIHPRFGNFIVLGTVLIDAEASAYGQPIDYNPCLECKLCVAACPVGAISPEGDFNFANCLTHNYREFMSGFADWVEKVADSKNGLDYRTKVNAAETTSMWQSLSFGANYKAAYCLAVCPAGEDVIGPFLSNKASYLKDTLRPLTEKEETLYVIAGSDAEEYAPRRFPKKKVKRVASGIRPRSIDGFLFGLKLTFQPGQAANVNAVYHFTFTGKEEKRATVTIRDGALQVQDGHQGEADLLVTADSETWLGFLAKERSLLWALLRRKIRIQKGSPRLLLAFGKCFPT
ncbi:MAG TPA: SCP2 sterol-binding domain-containing protein [Gemmataceae bacterium]|jgi:NAD-dependent dihydropyrimidine dehydrogenase PreA subunit|nr:SCP2 sterol-binding domain-containing protein [Gemmataceae bacterium]